MPPVRRLLNVESVDTLADELPLCYLDVGVELTVPAVMTRTALSLGLQVCGQLV